MIKIGDLVLATRHADGNPEHAWMTGLVQVIARNGTHVIYDVWPKDFEILPRASHYHMRTVHVVKITKEMDEFLNKFNFHNLLKRPSLYQYLNDLSRQQRLNILETLKVLENA